MGWRSPRRRKPKRAPYRSHRIPWLPNKIDIIKDISCVCVAVAKCFGKRLGRRPKDVIVCAEIVGLTTQQPGLTRRNCNWQHGDVRPAPNGDGEIRGAEKETP